MNYGTIKDCDIANGIGVRISLFVSGCRNHCKNCFNQQTWDFLFGKEFTQETMDYLISLLDKNYITGLSILGGEPFEPENQEKVLEIVKTVKEKLPSKNIWIYSGFVLEEILGKIESRSYTKYSLDILKNIDVLVDGKFIEEEKDIRLKFRGSKNQRIIDVKKTLETNQISFLEF